MKRKVMICDENIFEVKFRNFICREDVSMQSRLSKNWFRVLLFTTYLLVVGCSLGEMPFPRCISADYFGPKPVAVSAHFDSDNIEEFTARDGAFIDPETSELSFGFQSNQVVRWKDTGLETNGDDLVVRINGAWASWAQDNARESKSNNLNLEKLEQLRYEVKFENRGEDNKIPGFDLICSDYSKSKGRISSRGSCTVNCDNIEENSSDTGLRGAPCWFTNGYGAYFLFKRPGDSDPNDTLEHMRYPISPTIHLGYKSVAEGGDGVFKLRNSDTKMQDNNCNIIKLEKGWRIYVKILDRYYFDNVGGYAFEFLSGVNKPGGGTIFDYIYNYLKCTLLIHKKESCPNSDNNLGVAQEMFKNIAEKNTSFHNFVISLLILFLVISSLLYLFGMIQETKQDLLIRMMKFTLVVVLISPGSFEFFYNHFLILFVDGLEYLIKVIANFSPNANTNTLFSFMENMWDKFFAYSVWKKLAAFFFYQPFTSLLMVPTILIGIILYFLLCLYAFVIFLSGFVGVAFLIAIMPLFFISILFSQLRSLFEGWIKFCMSFCFKSIMIFALLSMLGALIMDVFYKQLGFTICYNKWLEVRIPLLLNKKFFAWTPAQIFVPYTFGSVTPSNIDKNVMGAENVGNAQGSLKFTGGAGYIPIPPSYINKGFRYIDYPFFNPFPDADHYIEKGDIVINKSCDENLKDLARLANSLSHTLEKLEVQLLISNIEGKIGEWCKIRGGGVCNKYKQVIGEYRNKILDLNLKRGVVSLVRELIENNPNCQLIDFHENYQDNSDYQRVQDIKRGDLLDLKGIFIFFLLSFLMFSLRELVQELGSNFAGGGYSVYTISSMYRNGGILSQVSLPGWLSRKLFNTEDARLMHLVSLPKDLIQNGLHAGIESMGRGINKLVGERILPTSIKKVVGVGIDATKLITSPENDIPELEDRIFKAFKVDPDNITYRKFDKYLNYYKGYVGSHLGYTLKDAMEFSLEHGMNSITKESKKDKLKLYTGEVEYKDNLFYIAKVYRKDFLQKLHEYTIGEKAKLPRGKKGDDKQALESNETVKRNLGTEEGGNLKKAGKSGETIKARQSNDDNAGEGNEE